LAAKIQKTSTATVKNLGRGRIVKQGHDFEAKKYVGGGEGREREQLLRAGSQGCSGSGGKRGSLGRRAFLQGPRSPELEWNVKERVGTLPPLPWGGGGVLRCSHVGKRTGVILAYL